MATLPQVWQQFQPVDKPNRPAPALLVSHYYIEEGPGYPGWPAFMKGMWHRSWCLDSGGFTAFTKGVTINFDEYTARAKEQLDMDPTLDMVFTLDNITSWRETLRN